MNVRRFGMSRLVGKLSRGRRRRMFMLHLRPCWSRAMFRRPATAKTVFSAMFPAVLRKRGNERKQQHCE
jgi:hypothetical protein